MVPDPDRTDIPTIEAQSLHQKAVIEADGRIVEFMVAKGTKVERKD